MTIEIAVDNTDLKEISDKWNEIHSIELTYHQIRVLYDIMDDIIGKFKEYPMGELKSIKEFMQYSNRLCLLSIQKILFQLIY